MAQEVLHVFLPCIWCTTYAYNTTIFIFSCSHDCIKRSLSESAEYPLCKANLTSEVGFVVPNFSC